MTPPSFLSEAFGSLLYALADMQPLILVYLHLIISALLPIYAASHASLSRPSSAQLPEKGKQTKGDEVDDEEEEEDLKVHVMEGLHPSDAVMFPILAGITLTFLYVLIKWETKWLNTILNVYFGVLALPATTQLLSDVLLAFTRFLFPRKYTYGNRLFVVLQEFEEARAVGKDGQTNSNRSSPLPGSLSKLPFGDGLTNILWNIRGFLTMKLTLRIKVGRLLSLKTRFGVQELISAFVTVMVILYYNFVAKPWWMTNLMGFAYSYSALRIMSPSTFATGTLMLVGLFFYDIYMVFFTPMMIAVAKALDAPIKLMFPRPPPPSAGPGQTFYSMLGLGDIVLPGIFVGLALRFDLYMYYLRKQTKAATSAKHSHDEASGDRKSSEDATTEEPQVSEVLFKAKYRAPTNLFERFWLTSWFEILAPTFARISPFVETFPKPYFHASLVGYILGLLATLLSMHLMQHGQPALLYLVPGVLLACWGLAIVRGELSTFYNFSEHEEPEPPSSTTKAAATKRPAAASVEELEVGERDKSAAASASEQKPFLLKESEPESAESNPSDTDPTDPTRSHAQQHQDIPHSDTTEETPKTIKSVRFELPEHRPRSPGNFEARKDRDDESSSVEAVLFLFSITMSTRGRKARAEVTDKAVPTDTGAATGSVRRNGAAVATAVDASKGWGNIRAPGYTKAKRIRLD
ncbi:hypothetical protein P152DRAFT_443244 [Eremomyces bilateralis CBS 781.70]|uniref:Intramembrane protease 2 n=1 Tax=Eremomyces bilateralis CBS 781.70 TaxID=1392243 RepID=A0A6G1FT12_9PEZI|nr:uncharacterized protein P152DRAFT_443244 [Eremomyces bilateralis CBS 781.70]KAF1808811.1 hypothetical protein P152DRAFT_443244 [Eremomyces bilateralis CBS 781.70]